MEKINQKFNEEIGKEKQGGFFDLPNIERCNHPEHEPPKHLYIPQGKWYKHICPNCGKVSVLVPPQIRF